MEDDKQLNKKQLISNKLISANMVRLSNFNLVDMTKKTLQNQAIMHVSNRIKNTKSEFEIKMKFKFVTRRGNEFIEIMLITNIEFDGEWIDEDERD